MFPPLSPHCSNETRARKRYRELKGGREEEEYGQVRRRLGREEEVRGGGRIARRRHGSERTVPGKRFADFFSTITDASKYCTQDHHHDDFGPPLLYTAL